jgi:hypothetical protein
MSQTNKRSIQATVFGVGTAIGLLGALLWLLLGEPWEVLADGSQYMAMFNGQATSPPFGYRVLTPFLAHLLPWSAAINFGAVTVACLSLASGFLALFGRAAGLPMRAVILLCTLWASSFAFIYYDTTRIRADAPMLMLMAAFFWLTIKRASVGWLWLVMAAGILSHETMLVCLPAIWLDKLLNKDLTGGRHYGHVPLIGLSLATLGVLVLVHSQVTVTSHIEQSYLDGPLAMVAYTLKYSGGPIKHVLRIYAAYGPALLFAVLAVAPWRASREALGLVALLLLAVVATFMATDTLRVMAIVYVPVLFYAARFVSQVWQRQGAAVGGGLIGLQLTYAYLVYGHLRTFKASHSMNLMAAALSALAVVLLAFVMWRERIPQGNQTDLRHAG